MLATSLPVLLDADALTLLVDGQHADDLRRDAPLVITPHDGEFARLAGEAPGADRVGAACQAGRLDQRGGAAQGRPDDRGHPVRRGRGPTRPAAPALATAGSGDVLAGLLGSLLAAGLPPERAAVAAAYVHGLAGRRAAAGRPGDRAGRGRALCARCSPTLLR